MKRLALLISMLLPTATGHAVDWRALGSPAEYQSMIDFDSVTNQNNFQRFMVRRAYGEGQPLPSGAVYHSTRLHFVADCKTGRAITAITAYYGEDRKLVHSDKREQVRRSELTPPEPGSDIAEALGLACQHVATGVRPDAPRAAGPPPVPAPAPRGNTSGSGIIVSESGHILTNHHVVNECSAHEVFDDNNRPIKATLLASDTQRDLALLVADKRYNNVARMRSDAAPRLGESITVVGFPLVGVLGTKPTVGFGHVSSTTGIRDNPSQMQISVPVQRGNSGGPVFDQAGNIIGMVVSKLDALKIAKSTGDLPQNVNFAIRGEVLRGFLEMNQIDFTASRNTAKLENTEIASQGAAVTVRVRCLRQAVPVTPVAAQP
jgi:S1-C subfamily serine protease